MTVLCVPNSPIGTSGFPAAGGARSGPLRFLLYSSRYRCRANMCAEGTKRTRARWRCRQPPSRCRRSSPRWCRVFNPYALRPLSLSLTDTHTHSLSLSLSLSPTHAISLSQPSQVPRLAQSPRAYHSSSAMQSTTLSIERVVDRAYINVHTHYIYSICTCTITHIRTRARPRCSQPPSRYRRSSPWWYRACVTCSLHPPAPFAIGT